MILVAGTTRIVGGMITRRLLGQGKEVRILVRRDSPSEHLAREGRATPAEQLIGAGAHPVYGDLRGRAGWLTNRLIEVARANICESTF
jgi:uncharacterized protein YbjT (DUF2867 family)